MPVRYYMCMGMYSTWRKRPLFLVALFLLATFAFNITQVSTARADVKGTPYLLYEEDLYKQLSAHQHYFWLYSCLKNVDIDKVTQDEVDNWDFFEGNGMLSMLGSMYTPSKDTGAYRKCNDRGMVKTAFNYLGYNDSRQTFCSLPGADYRDGHAGDYEDCIAGAGGHDWDNTGNSSAITAWLEENALPKKPPLTAQGEYMRAYTSFITGCDIKFNDDTLYNNQDDVPGAGDSSTKYAVPVVVDNSGELAVKYRLGVGIESNRSVYMVATRGNADGNVGPSDTPTCGQVVALARDRVEAYKNYLKVSGYDDSVDGSGTEGGSGDASEPVCSAGALGWVICPAMSLMADVIQWVAGTLEGYLTFNPFAGDDNDIKRIWSSLLNVANSLLVVAFLVVVFSQSTSLGLSNYGIKRMLPRIIAAAILMNLSYYICQILVDLSNIAGVGVTSLVAATTDGTFADNVEQVSGLSKVIVGAGIIAVVAFFFLIPVLLSFLAIIFTIAARNALIVLLVIVAPLAFAAWIFPNTEKYFKKWWELLVNMLLLFPLVMLMFASSVVAANVISSATPPSGAGGEELQGIIALLVLSLPLFAMPFLFKVAGGALGKINQMTKQGLSRYGGGDLANKGMQAMRGRTKERAGILARERQARIAERFGQGYEATGRGRRTRTALGKSVGWAASGQQRKQAWDERKANADQAFKTLYEEGRATNHTGRAALNAERKFELEQRAAGAHQMHDLHLAQQALDESSGLARVAAGVAGEAGIRRVQATAIAKEREESRKRVTAAQELLEYRERGLEWADTKDADGHVIEKGFETMYREQYKEAAAKGDHETMSAVLKNIHAKGSGGREVAADLLENTEIHGVDADTARKAVERTVYEDLQLGARADIVKGGMDTATGKWNLKTVGELPTKQIAALDGKVLIEALKRGRVDDKGQPVIDPATGQQVPEITAEQAYEIIRTPGLRQEVDGPAIIAMLEQRAAPRLQREREEQAQRPEPPSTGDDTPPGNGQ